MENLLKKTLEENKKRYIDALIGLLACDTQDIGHGIDGGNEANGQVFIEKILGKLGASIERDQMKDETVCKSIEMHGEGNPGHNYEDRFNVIATVDGKSNGKSIIFNGHVDTMPFGDLSKWSIDPLKPEIRDGKIYGRGACDMKGGLMGAIMALQLLSDAGLEPLNQIKIMSVVDEEGGGNGTIEAMMDGYTADAAIVCEPTSNRIQIAHVGFVMMDVKVTGKALHSAERWNGVSAIEKAMLLADAMRDLEYKWITHYNNPVVPVPNINVGYIHGGMDSSVVAENCLMKVCVHFPPRTMSADLVEKEFAEAMLLRAQGDDWLKDHLPEISTYQRGEGSQIDDGSPFVEQIVDIVQETMGYAPQTEGSTYGCDTRILQNIGKIPTITLGPGSITNAHGPDEYVTVEEYLEHILLCANIMLN